MVLYFSGTGNCRYAAERIAAALGDRAVSIEQSDGSIVLKDKEPLGVVFPTHFWEAPAIMRDFLENASITAPGERYSFAVAAYGSTPGCSGTDVKKLLAKKGVALSAAFSLRMPDTWTPVFDLSNAERVRRQIELADDSLNELIKRIKAEEKGNRAKPKAPYFVRKMSDRMYSSARRTTNFYVEQTCIGCGLCARECPVKAIDLQNGKPVWVKDQCTLCLRCLHSCPKFSIQYGDGKTKKHGQYRHPLGGKADQEK